MPFECGLQNVMKLLIYKTIHLMGVMMVFLSFGGLLVRSMLGSDDKKIKKLGAITNGVGLFLILALAHKNIRVLSIHQTTFFS